MDFVGKAKWNSWSQLGKLTKVKKKTTTKNKIISLLNNYQLQIDAEKKYIQFVNELCKTPTQQPAKYTTILTSIEFESVFKVVLNRPAKKNAFSKEVKILPN